MSATIEERTSRLSEALERQLGPSVRAALEDPDVVEVLLNPDGTLWLDTHSRGLRPVGESRTAEEAEALLSMIAGMLDVELTAERPILEAELPFNGSRLQGFLPPVVSAPAFALRKRATLLYTLGEYVSAGILTTAQHSALRGAVSARQNIVVSGGTGSGKTTLANALLAEMVALGSPYERIVLIEDLVELQCNAANHVALRTSGAVTLADCVRSTLRLRPDRLVIGEVRGREALDLLKSWNTGTPGGLTTVHANHAAAALERLDQLAQEASVPSQRALIASTVHLVVHLEGRGRSRRVTEILAVRGLSRSGELVLEAVR